MMLDHLRHTLIPLSAGLLLFSCSSDEPATSSCEMKFDISTVSRSAVTTADNITASPFAVFGDMSPEGTSDRIIIYNNSPVTYINSAWATAETQYWFNHHEHSFVAIHPASVLSTSDVNPQYSNSKLSFTYTLPSDPAKTADILTATHRRKYNNDVELNRANDNAVYLKFSHLMSLINLASKIEDNMMISDQYIEFRKLELSGFKTKANFNITPASILTTNQTDDRLFDINGREGEGMLAIEFSKPVKVVNDNKYVNLFDYNDAIIMLPQAFAADSDAKIILSYTINDDPTIKQVTLPLMNQLWEQGKTYTYRFTIDRTGIHFSTTSITDWDALNVGNIDAH